MTHRKMPTSGSIALVMHDVEAEGEEEVDPAHVHCLQFDTDLIRLLCGVALTVISTGLLPLPQLFIYFH